MNIIRNITSFISSQNTGTKIIGGISIIVFCSCCLYFCGLTIFTSGQQEAVPVTDTSKPKDEASFMLTITPEDKHTDTKDTQSAQTGTPHATQTLTSTAIKPMYFACIPNHDKQEAKVMKIIDGDTIVVRMDDIEYTVHYIGIDCPEMAQHDQPAEWMAEEAYNYNRELVENKTIILVKDMSENESDKHLKRYVYVDDVFVNYQIVKKGLAVAQPFPPDTSCQDKLNQAAELAYSNRMGMWGPTPIPQVSSTPQKPFIIAQPTQYYIDGQGYGCHPSYPDICIPYPPPDLDCDDIGYGQFTVIGSDPHNFDDDSDGIGCER